MENANSLKKVIELYIKNISSPIKNKVSELEVRFGVFEPPIRDVYRKKDLSKKPITRIDFENVVKYLKASGFTLDDSLGETPEQYYLRITEVTPIKSDEKRELLKASNTRLEIRGLDLIKKYCMYNDIKKIIQESPERANNMIKFTQKMAPLYDIKDAHSMVQPIKFDDFNYRISYKMEEDFPLHLPKSKESIENWQNVKKTFRFIKRYRFSHPNLPVFIDMSIVKTNQKDKNKGFVLIPTYTIQQAYVFDNPEFYEIEIEVSNKDSEKLNNEVIMGALRKTIHVVLSGIQTTNYPVSYYEQDHVLLNYLNLIYMEKPEKYGGKSIKASDFFGPSSETLQIENLQTNTNINILTNYSVTDKADGERKLLYICPTMNDALARIYLIDMNMNVVFTGKTTTNKDLYHTLIDGEHILYDKTGKFINQYMAFDIYFTYQKKEDNKESKSTIVGVRNYKFIRLKGVDTDDAIEEKKEKYRYTILKQKIKELNLSLYGTDQCSFIINVKDFYSNINIFESCSTVLNNSEYLTYNTDGLIFTPCHLPVPIDPQHGFKVTWNKSFKWKPVDYNTIDFYVSIKRDKNGKEMIKSNFVGGQDLSSIDIDHPYKIVELRCGYSKNDRRHKNPYNDVLKIIKNEYITSRDPRGFEESYTAELFKATNPFDPLAYLCYVPLERDDFNRFVMKTEEGDEFGENSIVEFKYDAVSDYTSNAWRWKPLRLRNDKTAKLLSGQKEYGNAFHVANNNWHSIHYPITKEILMTGDNIPKGDAELYYDNNPESKKNNTKSLRIFHNIVKSKLINAVSALHSDKTLIDYAVGKAGDLKKWIHAKIEFVFGVDIFRDNILNATDGACVRYIQDYEEYNKSTLKALFVVGDSSKHIRSGDAIDTPQEKEITRSIFSSPGQHYDLGKKYGGIAKNGFQISSCQFAIHYFFKNQNSLHGFLRNVAECTQLGGYFIGTTYDGSLVFDQLKKFKKNEGIILSRETINSDENDVIFKMTKLYDETGFPDDEKSLGYTISVFQDSIGKAMDEYLVNFEYFKRLMQNYGFSLVDPKIERNMDIPSGTGYFKDFYNDIINRGDKGNRDNNEYRNVREMKEDEKFISFLNRYFIFKKVNEVDTKTIFKVIEEQAKETKENIASITIVDKKPFTATKIQSKFTIKKFVPMDDEDEKSVKPFAIIVPFREQAGEKRKEQLEKFIDYMGEYLKDIPHKIFVIEQSNDGRKFNRGKLLNVGFKMASSDDKYSHFIFHDVDLLPSVELKKFYLMVSENPIHLAHVWKDRYDYANYFGGVVSFSKKAFENINGFPNNFFGYGKEDDALFHRTTAVKYSIVKPTKGSFEDLENINFEQKNKILKDNNLKNMRGKEALKADRTNNHWKTNGLNNLEYKPIKEDNLSDDVLLYTVDIDDGTIDPK
jgi:hypothetical protein